MEEDNQADVKEDSEPAVKADSEPAVKEDSKAVVDKDSEAAVKGDSTVAVKKKVEDKNLTEKQTELLPVKNTLKSKSCALGLKRLRRMGRTENYKGPDQDSTESFNPFMQGMPFGDKKSLPRYG